MSQVMNSLVRWIGGARARHLVSVHEVEVQSWLPGWLAPFLIAALVLLCVWAYRRTARLHNRQRAVLITLRSLAYALALLLLARPVLRIEGEGAPPAALPVIIDATESMQIEDSAMGSRLDAARRLVTQWQEEVGRWSDISSLALYGYDDAFHPVQLDQLEALGERTSLNQMLGRLGDRVAGSYVPGVLLLTDGAHNTQEVAESAWRSLAAQGIPVYPMALGRENARDLGISYVLGEDVVFLDEEAQIYVHVTQSGCAGRDVQVSLFLGEERVYQGSHKLEDAPETILPIEYVPPRTGRFVLRAEVETLTDEVTTENNSYVKNVRVIDEKIRILMVFGSPSWEMRYLAGAFERDNRVENRIHLLSVDPRLETGSGEGRAFVAKLPTSAREVHENYDIVMLSQVDIRHLPRGFDQLLETFVRDHTGALVLLADARHIPYSLQGSALEALLPVVLSGERPRSYRDELLSPATRPMTLRLTDDGRASPLVTFSGDAEENARIWRELPPIYASYRARRLKPSAINLLVTFDTQGGSDIPAIVHHAYGSGSVLYLGFDSTWRWRKEVGDRYFRDFWGKAVQYLGLPHLLNEPAQSSLFVSTETALVGEPVQVRAKISNPDYSAYLADEVDLLVAQDDVERIVTLTPVSGRLGMYKAEVTPEDAGDMLLGLPDAFSARPVQLSVINRRHEFRNPGMNRRLLESLAVETGGLLFTEDQGATVLKTLVERRPGTPFRLRYSLWDRGSVLLALLILFSLEWLFRKLWYLD